MRAGFEQQLDPPADHGITPAYVAQVRLPRSGVSRSSTAK